MKTISFSKLKPLLEDLRKTLHEQAQKELLDSIIEEIESLMESESQDASDPGVSETIKNILAYRTTDVVHRILIELLKHAALGEVLHWLKKLGD